MLPTIDTGEMCSTMPPALSLMDGMVGTESEKLPKDDRTKDCASSKNSFVRALPGGRSDSAFPFHSIVDWVSRWARTLDVAGELAILIQSGAVS